ncbi:MAG: proton-conducting transporter transmembrane domain-containing protein, partial [Halobacteriota archaeon]
MDGLSASYLLLALIFTPTVLSLVPLILGGFTQSKIVDYASTLIALITLVFASVLTIAYTGPVTAAVPSVVANNVQIFSFSFDALSLLFSLVVALMGCVIVWYSNSYMQNERGRGRYYFLMLFFIGGMLMLVNAANLVVFYIGWEIVGICSFLLVGFWYADPLKNEAAKKVFFFTHIPGEALLLFAVGAYAWTGGVNINA